MTQLRIVPACPADLEHYIDLLEEIAAWLDSRGVNQWPVGFFRNSVNFFSTCIERGEVQLAFDRNELVGTLRLLEADEIVWPGASDDALYVHSLGIRRARAGQALGLQLLSWAEQQALTAGKRYLRLDCIATNPVLRRYYEDVGFSSRGEVNAHYPMGTYRLQRYEKALSQ